MSFAVFQHVWCVRGVVLLRVFQIRRFILPFGKCRGNAFRGCASVGVVFLGSEAVEQLFFFVSRHCFHIVCGFVALRVRAALGHPGAAFFPLVRGSSTPTFEHRFSFRCGSGCSSRVRVSVIA